MRSVDVQFRTLLAVRSRLRARAETLALRSSTRRECQVAVVLVGWDAVRTRATLRAFDHAVQRSASLGGATIALVDNSGATGDAPGAHLVVRGSNTTGEFSGYDEGIAAVRASGRHADVWIFANDRFDSYADSHLGRLTAAVLDRAAVASTLAGRLDVLPQPLTLSGATFRTYCRSNLMVVSDSVLSEIGAVTTTPSSAFDELVPPAWPGSVEAAHQCIAAWSGWAWADFVLAWLTGRESESISPAITGGWYRSAPLTEASWPTVRSKINAIANEHGFSIRCAEAGAAGIELVALALAAASRGMARDQRLAAVLASPTRGAGLRTDRRRRDAAIAAVLTSRIADVGSRSA